MYFYLNELHVYIWMWQIGNAPHLKTLTMLKANPTLPNLPVLPILWRYVSQSAFPFASTGKSKLTTTLTCSISMPRAITFVVIKIFILLSRKRSKTLMINFVINNGDFLLIFHNKHWKTMQVTPYPTRLFLLVSVVSVHWMHLWCERGLPH